MLDVKTRTVEPTTPDEVLDAVAEAAAGKRRIEVVGVGSTLTVTSVMTASVPQEPAISLARS